MTSLWNKLIRWASVVRGGDDSGQFPLQQVEYLGKVADCIMIFPYGMHANVDGDSLAAMLAMNGNVDNRAAIPTSMSRRASLAPGEVTFYSPLTRSAVTFKANGNVEVLSIAEVIVSAAGKVLLEAGATVEIKGAKGAPVKGIVQGDCICAYTGQPHPMVSSNVKGSV